MGHRGGALRCPDVSQRTGPVARPLVVARCARTSTASSPRGWPRTLSPPTRRWTAATDSGRFPIRSASPESRCPSPSRSPSTFRVPIGPGARWGDEPACKPDSVPGPEPGWRSSICDDRCRPPGAIYPEARASSPRTLPRVPGGTLLDLAPGGVCLATPVTRGAGGLLHHRFTLTPTPCGAGAVCSLWHCPAGCPGWVLPTTLLGGVRTFLDASRHRDRPADSSARQRTGDRHRGWCRRPLRAASADAWERSHENRQPWRCRPGLRRAAVYHGGL